MTTATKLKELDPREEMLCELVARAVKKRQRRARLEGGEILQEEISQTLFGHNQQWLSRRLNGEVAFTTTELMDIGDWLGVNMLEWIERVKREFPGPGGSTKDRDSSVQYLRENLTVLTGVRDGKHHIGQLSIAS